MHDRAAFLIRELSLQPHPEGGHYAQTFKSSASVTPADGRPQRAALTSIYFLLAAGEYSRWHRVASDEIWIHLEGSPIKLWSFDGERTTPSRVSAVGEGGSPMIVIPPMTWQAAEVEGDYALAACCVAPGFEFDDFEMMSDGALLPADLKRLL